MNMLPDGAEERLLANANVIANACNQAGAQQWDIVGFQAYGQQLDIEAGKVTMAAGGGEGGFGVRVVQNGRFGFAHMVDVTGAEKAVQQAIKIAAMSPKIDGFVLPSEQDAAPVAGLFDSAILDVQPETLLEQADALLASVASLDQRAVVTGGGLGVSATASILMTSEGIESSGVTTSHGLGVQVTIDVDGGLTSSYQGESSRSLMNDVPACVEQAVHWAQITQHPIAMDSGAVDAPVLFTSEGIAPLFSMVVPPAMTGEKLVRKESFWSGKQNQRVLADHLSIVDEGRLEGGMSSGARDGEGVPRRQQTLINDGHLVGSLWSTRDAAQQVAEGRIEAAISTGSASAGGHQSPPSTGCTELMLSSKRGGQSWDQLVEQMDNGFIVNGVMGAHTANPTSGDFSVTTSSILRVVDGEVMGPLKQAGLSGNLARSLNQKVVLGDDARCQGSYSSGRMHLPAVLLYDELRINPA
ncbi:MAG: TldD/PmbA family protein [Candidatus Poseidoniales archaeon]|nr:MAG: TldD/PmbA family protein [Candidatus Poseidoniales archaeon]